VRPFAAGDWSSMDSLMRQLPSMETDATWLARVC
jgi:hypothetical protein